MKFMTISATEFLTGITARLRYDPQFPAHPVLDIIFQFSTFFSDGQSPLKGLQTNVRPIKPNQRVNAPRHYNPTVRISNPERQANYLSMGRGWRSRALLMFHAGFRRAPVKTRFT